MEAYADTFSPVKVFRVLGFACNLVSSTRSAASGLLALEALKFGFSERFCSDGHDAGKLAEEVWPCDVN